MATMTSLGIGSGLDLETMLSQLQTAEQTRLTPYSKLQSSYNAKLSSWGQISSSLSSLQTSVKKLSVDAFNSLNVGSNKAFTATATSEASADSHEITVSQLATAHKVKTGTFDDADQDLGVTEGGSRTLTIAQKNGKSFTVTLADDETSLNDIAKAINKEGGEVKASIQRTDNGYQLVLSSKTTGSEGMISVSVEDDDKLAAILTCKNGGAAEDENGLPTNDDSMTVVTEAKDAKLRVDGSDFTRSSNTISDIITGVSLDLKSTSEKNDDGSLQSEQLTLSSDTSAIKTSIKDFIKQYNALLTQTTAASKYVAVDTQSASDSDVATQSDENGALVGDSLLRGLVGDIRSTVNGVYGDSMAEYSALADLGITIDTTSGQMTLDESKLDEAIASEPEQIANLFQDHNGQQGISSKLNDIITCFIGDDSNKIDGQIKTTTDGLDSQVKIVETQIAKTQKLIDSQVERYRVQFQNLDTTLSKLTAMSNTVTAMFTSLES